MKFQTTIFLSLFCLLLWGGQAQAQKKKAIKGNGVLTKETRDFSAFTGVEVGGAFDVIIQKGNSHKASIEADENLMAHIKMNVKGNTLHIKMDGWVRKVNKLEVVITMEDMDHLSASGASDVNSEDEFQADNFKLTASGATDVSIKLQTDILNCSVSGSSDLEIVGSADDIDLKISGASDFLAENFEAKSVHVNASGSSSARIHASEELVAMASGSSDISCAGNPSKTDIQASGSADVDVD